MSVIQSWPVKSLCGKITIPGDKSISHRSLILGALAKGETILDGFLNADDCLATLNALQQLGVKIQQVTPIKVIIHGVGKYGLNKSETPIYCGNSATTMRLLSGVLAAQPFESELTGDSSLLKRPMHRVSIPLNAMGAKITTHRGLPPLEIQATNKLKGICYEMPEASAQVKSALLLAGMYARGETVLTEPLTTRDHTERLLDVFSYPYQKKDNKIIINNSFEMQGTKVKIPADFSSAAFFIVAATLIPNSNLVIKGVGVNSTRIGLLYLLQLMGANLKLFNLRWWGNEAVADIHVRTAALHGITIDNDMVPMTIDEFPILFIAASCAIGKTFLRGAKELRVKESDRIETMAQGLKHLGINVQVFEDGLNITGEVLQGGTIDSLGDHRIAMAFAIAGSIAKKKIRILNCDNIATSFPTFVETANQIGLNISYE